MSVLHCHFYALIYSSHSGKTYYGPYLKIIQPFIYRHKAEDILPYKDKEFDLAISLGVIHNLKVFDVKKAIQVFDTTLFLRKLSEQCNLDLSQVIKLPISQLITLSISKLWQSS